MHDDTNISFAPSFHINARILFRFYFNIMALHIRIINVYLSKQDLNAVFLKMRFPIEATCDKIPSTCSCSPRVVIVICNSCALHFPLEIYPDHCRELQEDVHVREASVHINPFE